MCNNDNTIKVYNLADMQAPVTSVRCPTPINYAALSKGLGLLACVGDCPEAMLYKATESGALEPGLRALWCRVNSFRLWGFKGVL